MNTRKKRPARPAAGTPHLSLSGIADNVEATNDLIENAILSPFATRSKEAWRLRPEKNDKLRPPFERDRHRVIFSTAYRGYRGRTQVFLLANYRIADRMVHINYVAQICRTLAKALKLNSDLAEAVAVSHDLGHAPFGHDGEHFLDEISRTRGIGAFHHNVQSVRVVDVLERDGKGLNLTFQVRDGIFSHDGEVHDLRIVPDRRKDEKKLQREMADLCGGRDPKAMPATLEGCIMRFSDTIAYIGSDIEDAVRLQLINIADLPGVCREKLGRTNGQIIDSIIADIIKNSYGRDYLTFSPAISEAVKILKDWNYKNIYVKLEDRANPFFSRWKNEREKVREGLQRMFDTFCDDIAKNRRDSLIFTDFLDKMSRAYNRTNPAPVKVRDYITTMTDETATGVITNLSVPKPLFQVIKWKKR